MEISQGELRSRPKGVAAAGRVFAVRRNVSRPGCGRSCLRTSDVRLVLKPCFSFAVRSHASGLLDRRREQPAYRLSGFTTAVGGDEEADAVPNTTDRLSPLPVCARLLPNGCDGGGTVAVSP